jgi:hypothetical protein
MYFNSFCVSILFGATQSLYLFIMLLEQLLNVCTDYKGRQLQDVERTRG